MATYSELKNKKINLNEIGGREVSIEELVNEVICNRRKNFLEIVTSLSTGDVSRFNTTFPKPLVTLVMKVKLSLM